MTRLFLLAIIVTLTGGLTLPARLDAADPLNFVPESSHVIVVADNPRKLAEAVTGLDAFKKAQQLAPVRELYDSTTARRLLQLLAFAEKDLGAKWPELLDQVGGNGIALTLQYGVDPAPVLAVLSGRDEKQVERAYLLALKVAEEELARQGSKETITWKKSEQFTSASIGGEIHTARIGATVLVSNKLDTLTAAVRHNLMRVANELPPPHKARRDAAKILPKDSLAWLWINFAAVKETKQAKDFFDASQKDVIQTFAAGTTIDCLKRAEFVAAGVYKEPTGFRVRLRIPSGRDGLWDDLVMHVPPRGTPGSLHPLEPPGTIYSQSMYLDAGYMWKHRERLITGDAKRDLEKAEKDISRILPTPIKLGEIIEMWGPYHRVVVANHDTRPYKTEPSLKLPAFGYAGSGRDPQFTKSVENVLRAAGLVGNLQFGVKMKEHEHEGVKIVAYRFDEKKPIAEDPDGLRFNFEPCFAVVGEELMLASTLELGRKMVTEMKAMRKAEGHASVLRGTAYAKGGADVLAGLADPLVTDSVLSRGIGLADARKEIADLVAFVRTLGTGRVELDVTDTEYRLDLVWEYKK